MNNLWFKKLGRFYLPVHMVGLITIMAAIVLLVPVYIIIIHKEHIVSNDLYDMFVYTTCTIFWEMECGIK
jgi:hypothetical protein